MFSVRVVTVNHYLSPPVVDLDVNFSDFRNTKVTQVPVIRVFGSTPAGQKTCLHIHGVFPYFYVPCDESEVSDKFMQQLALSIDTALQVGSGNASKYVQHVFKIIPVSGRQLYGYRSTERQFLKIYFYNPLVIRRASELLQSGAILNRVFQPYECHVPFNLQFFIDYNLYGMNLVNLAAVKFRRSKNDENTQNQSDCNESQLRESSMFNSVSSQHWSPSNIPGSQWLPDDVKRQSTCELEVDGVATDILNRLDLKDHVDTNPGLIAIWEDERQRREQLNQLSQLMPPSSPERGEMLLQEAEADWLERLTEVVDEQLKELEEHLPASEGDVSGKEDREEEADKGSDSMVASQSMANQLVDHFSQDMASQPQEGNVEAVINEELAMSLSQASVTGLSQAADKDLANLLMELGRGDDIDSDSVLSTQTPTASQEAGDGRTEDAAEEEEAAEKQESLEMSQVWIRDGDDEEEEEEDDEDGEEEQREQQEHNTSREEFLIPDVEDMSAFSQPELRSSQLPQLDGPNDPMPEKRRKKSKLQMVQEMRAIRASHQLTRSLPANFNPPSGGIKSPSFSHSLNFGGTNMNLTVSRKEFGRQEGRPPSSYSQETVGLYSQSFQQSMNHLSSQNRTQSYVGDTPFVEHVEDLGAGQGKLAPKRGRPPSAFKQKAGGFETTSSHQFKHQIPSGSSSLPDLNQDTILGKNGGTSYKSVEKKPNKKRGRPPSSSKQQKEGLQRKESESKKGAKDGIDLSTVKSKSTGNRCHSGTTDIKKTAAKRGRPPSSSKHKVKSVSDKVSKQKDISRDDDTVNIIDDDSVLENVKNFENAPSKTPTPKRGRIPKKIKIQFVGSQSGSTGVIRNRNDSSDVRKLLKCDTMEGKSPMEKVPLSLKAKKVNLQTESSPSKSASPNSQKDFAIISDEKLSTGVSPNSENNQKPFAAKKPRGRPPLSSTKQKKDTASSLESSPLSLEVPENEKKSLASINGSGLKPLCGSNIKPVKRRGRPPSKWKQKKETLPGQRSLIVLEGENREGCVSHINDAFQKETSGTVKSFLNGTSLVGGQGANNVQGLVSTSEGKSSDSLRASSAGVKESASERRTLGLTQKIPRKRGRPPLSLKKKQENLHHKYLTNIPTERKEGDRSPEMILETTRDGHTDRSSHLTSMSDANSDDTFHGMHSKGPPSLKKLKVKLTRVNLSQEGQEHSNLSQGDFGTDGSLEKVDSENMHEEILGQNVTGLGEVTDLVGESIERRQPEENIRKMCVSKNTKPRHLGMRRPYSYSNKFPGGTNVSVTSPDVVERGSINMKVSGMPGDDVEQNSSDIEVSKSAESMETAENGSTSDPLCVENSEGKMKSSAITSLVRKRPFEESEVDIRKNKSQKIDEEIFTNSLGDILPEDVTKEKRNVFPSELEEGCSINLKDFTPEQLSSMAVISPKIVLYRFGKKRSSPLPSARDEGESHSTPKIEKNNGMKTQTESTTASSGDVSEKVSPLLQGIAQQKKYIPANSKAARQQKVSEKRGGGRVEYSLLAGLKKYAKRKKESLQSPSEVQSQPGGRDGDKSEVIDLTSSSPDGDETGSPQEIEILSVQVQEKDSVKKSDRQLWTPNMPSGTKKKGRLSRGARSKKKGKGKSPGSSPSLKQQLQFFGTPSKSYSTKSPKSSQSSKSSKKSSQSTPQSTQQNGSQTPKRGRGRPRKLKLDGIPQADDKGKQNKEISDYFPVTKRGRGGKAGRNRQMMVGDKEAGKLTQRDAEDEVSFIQFLSGENDDNIDLTSQETKLDEIIDLLKDDDDDVSAILNVEKEIEVTSTPCVTDEDFQAIDGKEASDSVHGCDPKYPFLRTPSGSPYRDVLWNMSFTSPAVSSPRESPPKYWSPTDDTNKRQTYQSENSDQNLSCELLKSGSETQFVDSLDQNSNKEGYSGQRRESKDGDGRASPSLDMSEIGEYGNSQMALFEELHSTTTSEETFEERKEDHISNLASDGMSEEESREIPLEAAPPESGVSEDSKGDTIPKSTLLSPEGENGKQRSPEETDIDTVAESDTSAKKTDEKSDVCESGEKSKDDGDGRDGDSDDGGDEPLIPFPTTIPDSISEASQSDEDSSPLELMDSVSQIELLQSQLDFEKETFHVSDPGSLKEGHETVEKSMPDLTRVEEIGDGEKGPVHKESMNENKELSGRDEKYDGEGSPVISFQGTASQAIMLNSLDDTSTSCDGETSHEESKGGLKNTDKAAVSSGDGDSDVHDDRDDGLQQDESSKKEKAMVDEKLKSNRSCGDDMNIFERIGSLYKIPNEKSTSDEESKISEKTGSVIDQGQEEGSFDGTSSPVLEYQPSTILAGMSHSTAESEVDKLTGSEKSKDEDDRTLKSNEANESEESLVTGGGSSPVLKFQGSSSQMSSLQTIEDMSEKVEEQKIEDQSEKGQEVVGTDLHKTGETDDSGMEEESTFNEIGGGDEKEGEEQLTKDETRDHEEESSDSKGGEPEADKHMKSVLNTPSLTESLMSADQLEVEEDVNVASVEEKEMESTEVNDSNKGKEKDLHDCCITEKDKGASSATNQNDDFSHASPETERGGVNTNVFSKEENGEEVPITLSVGDSEICKEIDKLKKKDLDAEVLVEGKEGDKINSSVEKMENDEPKDVLEEFVESHGNLSASQSRHQSSVLTDTKISELKAVNNKDGTGNDEQRIGLKSFEDSSVFLKFISERKESSDVSDENVKYSKNNEAQRNKSGSSSDGSKSIDLSQYGIEKELNIPLRRLSLDDLPRWNQSGTSRYDNDDRSRGRRGPAFDFESIEHSQFQLSDSSEHDKANPCNLHDLQTSLNLQDSGTSDLAESCDDFDKSKGKSKHRKGRKESVLKKKKKKDKEKKKKQKKSESEVVGRKKRKSDFIGGSELSSQETEEHPPIKMVFRKVRHKKDTSRGTHPSKKKKTTPSCENWKLKERASTAKETDQSLEGKIPNLGHESLSYAEQSMELKPLILRKVIANVDDQRLPNENRVGVSNRDIPHDRLQRSLTDNVSSKHCTPATHRQIKGLELEQSLNADVGGVGQDAWRQGTAASEEGGESVKNETVSHNSNDKEFAWKDKAELISTAKLAGSQDQVKSDNQGLQNVENSTQNLCDSDASQRLNNTEARVEYSDLVTSMPACVEGISQSIVGLTAVTDGKSDGLEREKKEGSRLGVDHEKVTDVVAIAENMQIGDISLDSSGEQVFNTNEYHAPVTDGKDVIQTKVHSNGKSQTREMHKLDMSMRNRLNTAETEVIEALMGLSSDGGTMPDKHEEDAGESSDLVPSLVGFTAEEAHEIERATSLLEESTDEMSTAPTGEDKSYPKREQVPSTDRKVREASQAVETDVVVDQVMTHETEGSQEMPSMEVGSRNASMEGVFIPVKPPPTQADISASLSEYGLTDVIHQVPYWEKNADIPSFVRETANMQVHLNQNLPGGLKEALPPSSSVGLDHWRTEMFVRSQSQLLASQEESFYSEEGKAVMKGILQSATCKMEVVLTPCQLPPRVCDVTKWLKNQSKHKPLAIPKSSTSRTPLKPKSKELEKDLQNCVDHVERLSGDTSHDVLMLCSYVDEAPPSPFLQELIDQVEPSTPPIIDTPESPPSTSVSETLPCHSTPIVTGAKERPTQPALTPILITATKKTEPKLKKRVSLVDVPKIEQPKVVTPGQASMVTPLAKKGSFTSQLEGPTPKNTGAFKFSQSNLQDAKALHENQHLTLMSLELHVHTRGKLRPDPDFDPVRAIFFCIASENYGEGVGDGAQSEYVGVITVDNPNKNQLQRPTSNRPLLSTYGLPDVKVINASDEMEMLEKFIELVQSHDPDFLIGYEIQQLSWGYLLDRASALDVKLCSRISRLPDNEKESHFSSEKDAYGSDHTSEIRIAGRIVLNVWRLLRHEIALNVYTFENVAYHVLHQRVPLFSFQDLSAWYDHQTHLLRWRVVEHYMYRVIGNLKILKQMDLIGRTSELARLFGIQFFSVLSRGTQYRVESMMLRQAKAQNYVALSPSVQQRAVMKAPECLPLILEPESKLYEDPVIVLDFQSLYPSMMIGYNYCFSTCIGRVEHIAKGGHFVLGCTTHYLTPKQIKQLLDSGGLHVSPNGVVFVKKNVRHGILPRMLEQILQTRIMVKKGLKDHKEDKVLQRMLDNRQLGLKLIANVTYGYTSASFSGRMPCIEVGDSIVMKARETLERSIHLIETTPKWGARVVYGDTDSMFVIVKGATKKRAFEVGNEIVAAVSKVNPKPVKLKLEKVYKPCVLQAKKRYVGFKYESPDQMEPELEAKGIETIRRDTCPAVAKILEKSLKIIFTTQNMSQVKQYVQKQFQKIIDGRINQQDLVFAKEYRGRQNYKPAACVPALELTKRSLAVDKRSEPRVGERVPYVIVNGIPGLPLIQLVRRPEELASDPTLIINSTYYITRQLVPSLNRVFGIMGVETLQWYQELPRNFRVTSAPTVQSNQSKKGTISQYFCSLNCIICDQLTKTGLCEDCRKQPQLAAAALNRKIQEYQRTWIHLTKICRNCTGCPEHRPSCISIDCPNRFKIVTSSQKMESIPHLVQLLSELPAS